MARRSRRKGVRGIWADAFPRARVLLAEDDPITQEVSLGLLQEAGLHADLAVNGREAIDRVMAREYQLILMDVRMPVLDGLQATRAIRRLPAGETVPIVALTANAFADDRQQCLDAGMDEVLTKPGGARPALRDHSPPAGAGTGWLTGPARRPAVGAGTWVRFVQPEHYRVAVTHYRKVG